MLFNFINTACLTKILLQKTMRWCSYVKFTAIKIIKFKYKCLLRLSAYSLGIQYKKIPHNDYVYMGVKL